MKQASLVSFLAWGRVGLQRRLAGLWDLLTGVDMPHLREEDVTSCFRVADA